MTRRTRVFDASALVALFAAEPDAYALFRQAEAGHITIGVPATCVAEAESVVCSGDGWEAIFHTDHVEPLPLNEHAAVEIGMWPGPLGIRHAVREARMLGGAVVTCRPDDYAELDVPLLVV